jgi:hypothetical protein
MVAVFLDDGGDAKEFIESQEKRILPRPKMT